MSRPYENDEEYWEAIRIRAEELESDGCSGVPDFYVDCCLRHDIHYRTHARLDGTPITQEEADNLLWDCITKRSIFGKASPMAWWRWWALSKLFGKKAWEAQGKE